MAAITDEAAIESIECPPPALITPAESIDNIPQQQPTYTSKFTGTISKIKSFSPLRMKSFSPSYKTKKTALNFTLNKDKQTKQLIKSLQVHAAFEFKNFKFSKQGQSARLADIDPPVFKNFVSVVTSICGSDEEDSQVKPACDLHSASEYLPFTYGVETQYDRTNTSIVRKLISVYHRVGHDPEVFLAKVTAHYTTRSIQVQGNKETITACLKEVVRPLMEITSVYNHLDDNTELNCLNCDQHRAKQIIETTPNPLANLEWNKKTKKLTRKPTSPPPIPTISGSTEDGICSVDSTTTPQTEEHDNGSIGNCTTATQQTAIPQIEQTPKSSRHLISKFLPRTSPVTPTTTNNQLLLQLNKAVDRLDKLEKEQVDSRRDYNKLLQDHATSAEKIQSLERKNSELEKVVKGYNDLAQRKMNEYTKKLNNIPATCQKCPMEKTVTDLGVTVRKMDQKLSEHKDKHDTTPLQAAGGVPDHDTTEALPTVTATPTITIHPACLLTNVPPPTVTTAKTATRREWPTPEEAKDAPKRQDNTLNHRTPPPAQAQALPNLPAAPQSSWNKAKSKTTSRHQATPPPTKDHRKPAPKTDKGSSPPLRKHGNERTNRRQPRVRVIGDSNIGKLSSALKNAIPDVTLRVVPGSTFEHMIGDVVESDMCDMIVLSGGVNDACCLNDLEMARQPFRDLINTAKHRANRVIVMPPPPINHSETGGKIHQMALLMAFEAEQAGVEFVDILKTFPARGVPGPHLFAPDGKHMTQYGGGVYAWALLEYLYSKHKDINLNSPLCVGCHKTGHKVNTCRR